MFENELLVKAYECLSSRSFDDARKYLYEVLSVEPDNIKALRAMMFCDLGISELKEIKTRNIVQAREVRYEGYENTASFQYRDYFSLIKKYFDLEAEELLLRNKVPDIQFRLDIKTEEFKKVSGVEAKNRLLSEGVIGFGNGKHIPDVVGIVIFGLCLIISAGGIAVSDMEWYAKLAVFLAFNFIPLIFAAPGLSDLETMANSKKKVAEVEQKHGDIEGEMAEVQKRIEWCYDEKTNIYSRLREMDEKIMA